MTLAADLAGSRYGLTADRCVIAALRRGDPAVLTDPGGAVLVQAAASVDAASLHFAIRYSSGLIHAAMPSADLDRLRIPDQQVLPAEDSGIGFTVAVDAAEGIGTGISASDRATTLRLLAEITTTATDLVRPGHVLPIRCHDGGYQRRPRVWERAVDLVGAAGHSPVAMACRLVDEGGNPISARAAAEFGLAHRVTVDRTIGV